MINLASLKNCHNSEIFLTVKTLLSLSDISHADFKELLKIAFLKLNELQFKVI
jgi:hypothetical protein